MPCRAMIEMALVSLQAQLNNLSIAQFLAIKEKTLPQSVYTISASDSLHEMKQKLDFGLSKGFEYFKLKLIDEDVAAPINNYRALTDKPFAVDANQSWNDVQRAIANAAFLKQNGCFLIEQPFQKSELQKAKDLTAENILPIYADEDCQVLSDMEQLALCYNGINIKLMKCGGIYQAMNMIKKARQLDLNVLIGCMSESSIGCDAAAVLAPLCDFADLDGPFLITNDFDESNFTS